MSAEITADDALATVGRALRLAASQDAHRDFWARHERARAENHAELYQAAYVVHHLSAHGLPPSAAALRRLGDALQRKRVLDAAVEHHVERGAR